MTESNLYKTPESNLSSEESVTKESKEFLLSVAKRQKHLLYTFVCYLILLFLARGTEESVRPIFQLANGLVFICIIIFNARLCWVLYGALGRTILIVLGILPLINLIVVLVVNSKANSVLKEAGYKVGFMGAKVSEISN